MNSQMSWTSTLRSPPSDCGPSELTRSEKLFLFGATRRGSRLIRRPQIQSANPTGVMRRRSQCILSSFGCGPAADAAAAKATQAPHLDCSPAPAPAPAPASASTISMGTR